MLHCLQLVTGILLVLCFGLITVLLSVREPRFPDTETIVVDFISNIHYCSAHFQNATMVITVSRVTSDATALVTQSVGRRMDTVTWAVL